MPELSPHDALSAHDRDDVQRHMVAFIRRNFSDVLGRDIDLLSLPEGLALIRERVMRRLAGSRERLTAALERLAFDR